MWNFNQPFCRIDWKKSKTVVKEIEWRLIVWMGKGTPKSCKLGEQNTQCWGEGKLPSCEMLDVEALGVSPTQP